MPLEPGRGSSGATSRVSQATVLDSMILEPSTQKAVAHVKSGQRVFIHGIAATPSSLYAALLDRAEELSGVEIVAISTLGEVSWNRPAVREHVFLNSLF